jgi:ferredoxin
VLRARLCRARMLVKVTGDCASDPPLSATLRAIACARPDDVLLGLAALSPPKEKLRIAVRHDDAETALREAALRAGAKVEIVRLPDAWPPLVDGPDARVLVAASPRRKDRARYVTVAGAVRQPAVIPVRAEPTISDLVASADGPLDDDWLPLVEHRLLDRDAPWAGEPLVTILPARHPLVRNARTPLADWLQRAASACEGCRICSESCGHLEPHEIMWTLTTLRDDGVRPLSALACTSCGLCDAMCPSALSPRALIADVRDRLRSLGAATTGTTPHRSASGLDIDLLTRRLGLAEYDRSPLRKL